MSLFRRARTWIFEQVYGQDPRNNAADEIADLLERAHNYFGQRRTEEARQLCEHALFLSRRYQLSVGEALSLRQLGAVYSALGRYEVARQCAYQAWEIACSLGASELQSDALISLGVACREIGQLDLALDYLQQALGLLDRNPPRPHDPDYAASWYADRTTILRAIGKTHLYRRECTAAVNTIQQALEIALEADNRRGIFEASFDLAYAHLLCQNRDGAIQAILRLVGGSKATKLANRGLLDLLLELDRRAQTYDSAHRHAAYIINLMQGIACELLGTTQKDYKAKAMEHYEAAWKHLEAARSALTTQEARLQFLSTRHGVFRPALNLALDLYDYTEAFEWMERVRSRTFVDSLAITDRSKTQVDSEFLERWIGEPVGCQDIKLLLT